MTDCTQLPQQRKAVAANAAHDQQSVSHCRISLSVSKSKLVYSSLIFLDNYNNNNDRLTAFDPGQPG